MTPHRPGAAALVRAVRAVLAWQVDEPAPPLAWPAEAGSLRAVATSHFVAPVLAPWRERLRLDDADVAWLAAEQRLNAARALRTAQVEAELTSSLAADGVDALVLKGLPLALRTTGDLAGRHCGDIDVLVSADRLADADGVLRAAGYAIDAPPAASPLADPYRRWVLAVDNHAQYSRPGGPHIEVHWRLTRFDLLPVAFDDLWARRRTVDVGGVPVAALGTVDDLLFVGIHAAKHDFVRLQWAVDVARLVRGADAREWRAVIDAAHRAGVAPLVEVCRRIAGRLLPMEHPADARLSGTERRRVDRLVERMWAASLGAGDGRQVLSQQLAVHHGVRTRAWLLARSVAPPFLLGQVDGRFAPLRLAGRKLRGRRQPPESATTSR